MPQFARPSLSSSVEAASSISPRRFWTASRLPRTEIPTTGGTLSDRAAGLHLRVYYSFDAAGSASTHGPSMACRHRWFSRSQAFAWGQVLGSARFIRWGRMEGGPSGRRSQGGPWERAEWARLTRSVRDRHPHAERGDEKWREEGTLTRPPAAGALSPRGRGRKKRRAVSTESRHPNPLCPLFSVLPRCSPCLRGSRVRKAAFLRLRSGQAVPPQSKG